MSTPILIEDYNPHWPEGFAAIRSRIAPQLRHLAAAIEHIGSTSVPGLAAAPILDIAILLKPTAELSAVTDRLFAIGYQPRAVLGGGGCHAFQGPPHDMQHGLDVCSAGNPEFFRRLAFRDYLRGHPGEVEEYTRLKRALATRFRDDGEAYQSAKAVFVNEILRRVDSESREPSSRAARTNS